MSFVKNVSKFLVYLGLDINYFRSFVFSSRKKKEKDGGLTFPTSEHEVKIFIGKFLINSRDKLSRTCCQLLIDATNISVAGTCKVSDRAYNKEKWQKFSGLISDFETRSLSEREQQILTVVWSQGKPFCWGILYDKYGCLQVHRYKSVDAWQDGNRWHPAASFRWGWYNGRSGAG